MTTNFIINTYFNIEMFQSKIILQIFFNFKKPVNVIFNIIFCIFATYILHHEISMEQRSFKP